MHAFAKFFPVFCRLDGVLSLKVQEASNEERHQTIGNLRLPALPVPVLAKQYHGQADDAYNEPLRISAVPRSESLLQSNMRASQCSNRARDKWITTHGKPRQPRYL